MKTRRQRKPSITSQRLRQFRERLNLTQAAIAAEIGIDEATYWRWENGSLPKRGLGLKALESYVTARSQTPQP